MKLAKCLILLTFFLVFCLSISAQAKSPKTVREFFTLLPQKYFEIEDLSRDKNQFLERFLKVEDNKNGYLECDGDGSQENIKMVLFKRSNGTYIIGLYVSGEWGDKSYFFEYRNRRWFDVSKKLVPQYRKSNIYDFPRFGTTTTVSNWLKVNNENTEQRKIYDLVWENDKFTIKK